MALGRPVVRLMTVPVTAEKAGREIRKTKCKSGAPPEGGRQPGLAAPQAAGQRPAAPVDNRCAGFHPAPPGVDTSVDAARTSACATEQRRGFIDRKSVV